jgi:hypothetical protein
MTVITGSASLGGSVTFEPTGSRDFSGRHVSPVPDLLNGLPLGFAPIAGVGRYVARASVRFGVETSMTPNAVAVFDGTAALAAEAVVVDGWIRQRFGASTITQTSSSTMTAQRLVSPSLAFTETVACDPSAMRIADGVSVIAAETVVTPVCFIIRHGASRFRQFYVPAGAPEGRELNSAPLGWAPLVGSPGGYYRCLATDFSPTGSCVRSGNCAMGASSEAAVVGVKLLDGVVPLSAAAEMSSRPVVIFSLPAILSASLATTANGSVLRDGVLAVVGAATLDPSGVYKAKGAVTLAGGAGMAPSAAAVFDAAAAMAASGEAAPLAGALRFGALAVSEDLCALVTGAAVRDGVVSCVISLEIAALPAFPHSAIESCVYASAFDTGLGVACVESSFYYAPNVDTVYRPTRESVVWGNVKD